MSKFKHSYSVHVHANKKSATCSLSLLVSVNSVRKDISLGINIPMGAYDKASRSIVPIPGYTNAAFDNLSLQQRISDLERTFLQLELSPSVPTIDDVVSAFRRDDTAKPQQHKVVDIIDRFVADQSVVRSWSDGTVGRFSVVRNRIAEFQSNALMSQIDDDWIVSFMKHLSRGYTKTLKSGEVRRYSYKNNSLAKMFKTVRWFLRWAKKKGYYEGTSENFSMDFKGGGDSLSDIVYLSAEELHLLMDHHWQHGQQHLERCVDAFIFACYCGLRYSDIAALRRYHIHDGQIFIATEKTDTKVVIPLNKVTNAILDKYHDYVDAIGHPFPVISDQKMNKYLKEAARVCGINSTVNRIWYEGNRRFEESHKKCDVLSFHCARRTFITQALVLGIPDSVLIQFTGHANTKMLRRYQGVVDDLKLQQISKFDTL